MAEYHWRTIIFSAPTPDEATAAFDEWFDYAPPSGMAARPNIREMAHRALYYHLTHHPWPDRYELHVTALLPDEDG